MKHNTLRASRARRGFTLIELLVVIAIIAILAAMLLPVFASIKKRAQMQQARLEIGQIVSAIHRYEADYSRFPVSSNVLNLALQNNGDFTYGVSSLVANNVDPSGNPAAFPVPGWYGNYVYTNNSEVMAILMDVEKFGNGNATLNQGHMKNPQGTKYLSAVMSGTTASPGVGLDGVYRDPWGNPYIITFDLNNDDKARDACYCNASIATLSPQATTGLDGLIPNASGQYEVNDKVMVWSVGPDKYLSIQQPSIKGFNKDNVLSWK